LAILQPTQPVGELKAKINALMLTPGADDCQIINGPVTRRVCPEVATLRTELARAERRADLQHTLAKAQRTMAAAPAATEPDPLASALAVYLAALGWDLQPGTLAPWLYLIPVFFLEFGSALGVVLVRAVLAPETASHVEQNYESGTLGPASVQGVQFPEAKVAKTLESQASRGVQGSVPAIQAKNDNEDDDSPPG
jgi:hypothetical protein